MNNYGREIIVDLHGCNTSLFTEKKLRLYFEEVCKHISMTREDLHFWSSYENIFQKIWRIFWRKKLIKNPKTWGISAIQFIITSNITIHALPLYKNGSLYLNLFSCKDFDPVFVAYYTKGFFMAKEIGFSVKERV